MLTKQIEFPRYNNLHKQGTNTRELFVCETHRNLLLATQRIIPSRYVQTQRDIQPSAKISTQYNDKETSRIRLDTLKTYLIKRVTLFRKLIKNSKRYITTSTNRCPLWKLKTEKARENTTFHKYLMTKTPHKLKKY